MNGFAKARAIVPTPISSRLVTPNGTAIDENLLEVLEEKSAVPQRGFPCLKLHVRAFDCHLNSSPLCSHRNLHSRSHCHLPFHITALDSFLHTPGRSTSCCFTLCNICWGRCFRDVTNCGRCISLTFRNFSGVCVFIIVI